MNCANHPDRERVAFCQNCGKPLCAECVRNVGASIFCEPCLAARVAAAAPPRPAIGIPQPGRLSSGLSLTAPPNPTRPRRAARLHPRRRRHVQRAVRQGRRPPDRLCHFSSRSPTTSLASSVSSSPAGSSTWSSRRTTPRAPAATARPCPIPSVSTTSRSDSASAAPGAPARPTTALTPTRCTSARRHQSRPGLDPGPASAYAPPVSHWGAPQDAYTVPPIPPMPPMPPYPDPSSPTPAASPRARSGSSPSASSFWSAIPASSTSSIPASSARCCSSASASGSSSTG